MVQKIEELLDWQEELREEGILDKKAFINFVRLHSFRFISMNMIEF